MEISVLILLYLIIGHLVGDFLLQTTTLVNFKHRSVYGILLHSFVILAAQILLLIPYLGSLKVILSLILIGVLHFLIDYSKIKLKIASKYPIVPFILDQLAHFIVLFLAYLIIQKETPILFIGNWWFDTLYQNTTLLVYFAGVIFFSYALDIVYLTLKLRKHPNYKYKRGYFDMLLRVSLFALIYTTYSAYFA